MARASSAPCGAWATGWSWPSRSVAQERAERVVDTRDGGDERGLQDHGLGEVAAPHQPLEAPRDARELVGTDGGRGDLEAEDGVHRVRPVAGLADGEGLRDPADPLGQQPPVAGDEDDREGVVAGVAGQAADRLRVEDGGRVDRVRDHSSSFVPQMVLRPSRMRPPKPTHRMPCWTTGARSARTAVPRCGTTAFISQTVSSWRVAVHGSSSWLASPLVLITIWPSWWRIWVTRCVSTRWSSTGIW